MQDESKFIIQVIRSKSLSKNNFLNKCKNKNNILNKKKSLSNKKSLNDGLTLKKAAPKKTLVTRRSNDWRKL